MAVSGPVVAAAATTVGSVLLLNLLGILTAHFPKHPSKRIGPSGIIPQQLLAPLASLTTNVLLPCLIFFSLGSRLTPDVLKEAWPSALWAAVNIGISVLVALPLALLLVPRSHWREFTVAASFSNVGPIPLVMMEVLCDQEQLAEEEDCFERSVTFVFVHVFGWSIVFWTLGVAVIKTLPTQEGASSSVGRSSLTRTMVRGLLSAPLVACAVGAVVGLVQPLRRVFFAESAPLRFVASAANTYGTTVVGLAVFVMAATLGKSLSSLNPLVWFRCAGRCGLRAESTACPRCGVDVSNPQQLRRPRRQERREQHTQQEDGTARPEDDGYTLALMNGVGVESHTNELSRGGDNSQREDNERDNSGCFPSPDTQCDHAPDGKEPEDMRIGTAKHDDRGSNNGSLRHTAEALEHRSGAGAAGCEGRQSGALRGTPPEGCQEHEKQEVAEQEEVQGREAGDEPVHGWGLGTTVLFLVVTLGLVPVLRFGLLVLVGDMVFVGDDAMLLQLVVALQSVTPAATLTVVLCQREDKIQSAQHISRAVVSQYCCALVTLLVATTLAVDTFYSG